MYSQSLWWFSNAHILWSKCIVIVCMLFDWADGDFPQVYRYVVYSCLEQCNGRWFRWLKHPSSLLAIKNDKNFHWPIVFVELVVLSVVICDYVRRNGNDVDDEYIDDSGGWTMISSAYPFCLGYTWTFEYTSTQHKIVSKHKKMPYSRRNGKRP